jgi:hypothetical protein
VKRLLFVFIIICSLCQGFIVSAAQAQYDTSDIEVQGFGKSQSVYDGNRNTYTTCKEDGVITITNSEGIAGIYVEFDRIPSVWTLINPATGESVYRGENSFLHEFVAVDSL